jgi:hypothetical protein
VDDRLGTRVGREPHGCEDAYGLIVQPTEGECDGVPGRRVEPLSVVDGEDDWPLTRKQAHGAEKCRPDRVPVDGDIRLALEKERGCKRSPLWFRKLRENGVDRVPEEITQACERELGIGAGRPRPQHEQLGASPETHTFAPDTCLSDPRLALEEEGASSVRNPVEEHLHGLDLGRPADDWRAQELR